MAVITEPVLYLDTNHISQLARFPNSAGARAVLPILRSGDARLAISLLHLLELSDPNFKDRPQVGEMLDTLPIAWARWVLYIFADEIQAAIASSLGTSRGVVAFLDTMAGAWVMPPEAAVPLSVALETTAENPHLRAGMMVEKQRAAKLDAALKTSAAVVRDPLLPLISTMREEHDLSRTPSGLRLPSPIDPVEVLRKVGGVAALPAYQTFHVMHRARLGDEMFPTTGNDVMDDLHACYGPYATVLLLDRATLGRLRSGKVPYLDRCGRKLEDVPRLLGAS